MTITFFGAAKQVTGSLFLVKTKTQKRILIECGLYQGGRVAEARNYQTFEFKPSLIDLVIVSHAHLDHIGRLPKLVKEGYRGPIVTTKATARFGHLVLLDAQELIEEEAQKAGHEVLYSVQDVNALTMQMSPVDYGVTTTIDGVNFRLLDAGHILGSAIIELVADGQTVIFSGDLGNAGTPILQPTQVPQSAQVVVMESTYGGRIHEPVKEREAILRQTIIDTVSSGGVLMIPAFAIERTQELLYEIDQLQKQNKIPKLPIFLDSPLAIKTTAVFERYSNLWNRQSQVMKASGDNFFHFPGLTRTPTVAESKKINDVAGPKVIIAGAGMMHGGRILHHLKRYLPDERSTLLVVGYQAKGTLGRALLDGTPRVKIHSEWVNVRAKIKPIGAYSAHADGPQLVQWLSQFAQKPEAVYLVHGELDEMVELAQNIEDKLNIKVTIPQEGQTVEV